jgi:hypothetical protein
VTVRATIVLAGLLAGCFDTDGGETIADPGGEIFDPLLINAPTAPITPPITLDSASCAYARYTAPIGVGTSFVLVHPSRTKCELWLGLANVAKQYCRFDRDAGLFAVELVPPKGLRVTDPRGPCIEL